MKHSTFIIFLLFISHSCAILIHMINLSVFENQNLIDFQSHYTTLGLPPNYTLHSSIVILSKHNFSDDCSLSPATNITHLQGI